MGWFGTVLGSSIGFVFGGPLGAIGGAALGHILLDRNSNRAYGNAANIHAREKRQAGYFLALFSIMGKIAVADGKISTSERQLVSQFIRQSGMSNTQGEYALRIFEEAAHSPHSVHALADQFYRITAGQSRYHLNFMDFLVRLAAADGTLHGNERRLLEEVASSLHVNTHDLDLLLTRATYQQQYSSAGRNAERETGANIEQAYSTLGCTKESSENQIRSAYRRLAAAYHPDKILSKDLPEEFTQLATEKFQEIQNAYQTIKGARGIH